MDPASLERSAFSASVLCDFVKIFPCGSLGGSKYIKALKAPFPDVRMIPTGGISLKNAADFLRVGADALGRRAAVGVQPPRGRAGTIEGAQCLLTFYLIASAVRDKVFV